MARLPRIGEAGGLAMGSLWLWLQKTEPEPRLWPPWPLPRLPGWAARMNESITKQELDAVRLSAQRGKPFGNEAWVESMARRLNLESTIRPRGRPQVRFPKDQENKEDRGRDGCCQPPPAQIRT